MTENNPNPFLANDDEDESSVEDTPAIRQIRNQLKKEQREKKQLAEQLEELAKFRASVEQEKALSSASGAFKQAGLPDRLGELYLKANPESKPEDITPEVAKSFAAEYGLAPKPAEQVEPQRVTEAMNTEQFGVQSPPSPVQQGPSFTPAAGGSNSPWEPVTSHQLVEAARRGDMSKLVEAANRELQNPGHIKYKYEHIVNAEDI